MLRIGNTLIDPAKISFVWEDEHGTAHVVFDNGQTLEFKDEEARELWRELDENPGWKIVDEKT